MMRLVAAMCLAVASLGCGAGREIRPDQPGYGPVGEAAIPALHDQINGMQGDPGRVELVPEIIGKKVVRDPAGPPRPASPPASALAAAPPDSVPALPWPADEAAEPPSLAAPAALATPLDAPAPPPMALEPAPAAADPGLMRASASMPSEHDGPPGLASDGPAPAVATFGSLPPPPAGPAPPPFPPPAEAPPSAAAQLPPAEAKVDPAVLTASAPGDQDKMALAPPAPGQQIGEWAARVNEDIITWNELTSAAKNRLRDVPPEEAQNPQVRDLIVVGVLDNLIDQTLLLQHARRNELKNEKAWEHINKEATKFWERDQLPGLLKQYQAKDLYELERKLVEAKRSLHDIQESYRHEFIARTYMVEKVRPRIHVDLPEILTYYHENRGHEQFHQPEQITWREVAIEVANHPDRATARAKADQALARIVRGEDFARVAAELGEGPNAGQGGLWEKSSPGSYAVPAVNEALASLAPGQPSPILESPDGYHIVRVEEHTQAGILPFADVQTKIREILWAQKQDKAMEEYLKQLYRGAVITTVFREYIPRDRRNPTP
jgi:hypothetical protein